MISINGLRDNSISYESGLDMAVSGYSQKCSGCGNAPVDPVSAMIMSRNTVREDTDSYRALNLPYSLSRVNIPEETSFSPDWFSGWMAATECSGLVYVEPAADIGLAIAAKATPFEEGYGLQNEIIVNTNLNNVGNRLSQAHDLMHLYRCFKNTDEYAALVKHLTKKGYNAPTSPAMFAAGYLEEGQMAAVTSDGKVFYLNKDSSGELSGEAASNRVSLYAQLFYIFCHETAHLSGIEGTAAGEKELETVLMEFFKELAGKEPKSVRCSSHTLTSNADIYNAIAKIAKKRLSEVQQNYGGILSCSSLEEAISYSANKFRQEQSAKVDIGALTNSLAAKYAMQAKAMGLTGNYAEKYVSYNVRKDLAKYAAKSNYKSKQPAKAAAKSSTGKTNSSSKNGNNTKASDNKGKAGKGSKKGSARAKK